MQTIKIMPRDLRPGDQIERLTKDIDVVWATITEVKKVRQFERTVYKIYLDRAAVPESQIGWAEHRHLSPFILQPRTKVTVQREES